MVGRQLLKKVLASSYIVLFPFLATPTAAFPRKFVFPKDLRNLFGFPPDKFIPESFTLAHISEFFLRKKVLTTACHVQGSGK